MFFSPTVRTSLIFLAIALVGLLFADMTITASNPWRDLGNFFLGVITPNFFSSEGLMTALLRTVAFAFVGVALGGVCGFLLSLVYRFLPVRIFCAFIRAIHELFWALIFLQFFGFHPLTGVLAIAIPYSGIFAKVYSEILRNGLHRSSDQSRDYRKCRSTDFYRSYNRHRNMSYHALKWSMNLVDG